MMAVISPMLVQQTERGDDMFMATFARHCQQVLDLEALETLPPPAAPRGAVARPGDEDLTLLATSGCGTRAGTASVADPEQGIGAYSTSDSTPRKGRPGTPRCSAGRIALTVALVDFAAPLPGDDLTVRTEALESKQVCERRSSATE